MGWAHSYCRKCGNGLAPATAEEVTSDAQQCPHCETFDEPNRTRDALLVAMANEIENLTEKLNAPRH